jgi:hypothetical protein
MQHRMQQAFCCKNEKKVKKRSVHAGPKQTAKCDRRRRAKLSSKHALEVSSRRARVAELAAGGLDLRQCEELLKQEGFTHSDHSTLSRDLKRAREQLNQATLLTVARHRDQLTKNLLSLEQVVRERGLQHDDYVPDLLAIFNQLAKLLGLNADTRVAVVAVNNDGIPPERLVGWRRWLRETRDVPESALDEIYQLCRRLSQPATAETTALIGPPADSPLWHDDEEEQPN